MSERPASSKTKQISPVVQGSVSSVNPMADKSESEVAVEVAELEKAEKEVELDNKLDKGEPVLAELEPEDEQSVQASLLDGDARRFEGEEPLPSYTLFDIFKNAIVKYVLLVVGLALLIGYTIAVVAIDFDRGIPIVFLETFVVGVFLIKFLANRKMIANWVHSTRDKLLGMGKKKTIIAYGIVMGLCFVVAFFLTIKDLSNLSGLGGLLVLIALCYALSWDRKAINWRPVVWGFTLQFFFGVIILRTTAGKNVFQFFGDQIAALQTYTNAGSIFVFGENLVALAPFAFQVLPVIILYAGFAAMLFHWGILQAITNTVGNIMQYTMGTSAPESLNAAGNIFLGQTESPLLIRPYLKHMTNSEIHAVMTGGFATIAGGVLVAFIANGIPAEHLLSASVMSAPAALAISKIVYPETIKVDDTAIKRMDLGESYTNALEAFSRGASMSIGLIANIVVNLIAFIALMAFLDEIVSYFTIKLGVDDVNFQTLVGYVFAPLAFLMGIPVDEIGTAGELLGTKVVANEFVAFSDLGASDLDPEGKTFIILTYALCGFSNFSSIGIQLGALGSMCPEKIKVMSSLALSAMICGNIACFMTACIASALIG